MASSLAPSQPTEEFDLTVSWKTKHVLSSLNGGFALLIPLGVLAFAASDAETMAIINAIPSFTGLLIGLGAFFACLCVLAFVNGFEAPRRVRIMVVSLFIAITFITICLFVWARFFVVG